MFFPLQLLFTKEIGPLGHATVATCTYEHAKKYFQYLKKTQSHMHADMVAHVTSQIQKILNNFFNSENTKQFLQFFTTTWTLKMQTIPVAHTIFTSTVS